MLLRAAGGRSPAEKSSGHERCALCEHSEPPPMAKRKLSAELMGAQQGEGLKGIHCPEVLGAFISLADVVTLHDSHAVGIQAKSMGQVPYGNWFGSAQVAR